MSKEFVLEVRDDISEKILFFTFKPNALLSSADITKYKHPPFSYKKSHVTHSNMSSVTSSYIFLKIILVYVSL